MNSTHGGDITGYALRYGRKPIDFSASLNPLGMPAAVKAAAIDAMEDACHYPDPYGRALTAALGEKLKINPKHLILGNGAADLIHRYVQALRPRKALLPVPSFAEYGRALGAVGCEVFYHFLTDEGQYGLDEGIVEEITEEIDLIFLCQPGNPTGQLIPAALLEKILERSRRTGTQVFLDECFLSFVDGGHALSMGAKLEQYPNLFILGSFTKLYAMAGLRLGYGLCADTAQLDRLALNGQPWGVSTVAQAAGLAALGQEDYVKESIDLIRAQREWLKDKLCTLGARVLGGAANYLFFFLPDGGMKDKLARLGYLIRDCANFPGLGPGYYRIAVRTAEENRGLIEAMGQALNEGDRV